VLCARSIDCRFSRIQLTPDLLPGDVLGVSVFNNQTHEFEFKPGPVFANIVLADEINRTTPRTQSALLEAMSEEQVSIENQTHPLERPFMVVATQNPFEFEGTYHLPENQLDRFLLRISVGYPERQSEYRILTTQPGRTALNELGPVANAREIVEIQDQLPSVRLDAAVVDYILDLADATRRHDELHLGVSPRGALAITHACQANALLERRDYVTPDDVKNLFIAACAHRVIAKSYLQSGEAPWHGFHPQKNPRTSPRPPLIANCKSYHLTATQPDTTFPTQKTKAPSPHPPTSHCTPPSANPSRNNPPQPSASPAHRFENAATHCAYSPNKSQTFLQPPSNPPTAHLRLPMQACRSGQTPPVPVSPD